MNAVWRWLFIYTDLGSLMNTNIYCHCWKGKVWICPKVWYNERVFPYGLSLCLLHQNRSLCVGFKRAERVKGRRSSLYISFLSIRHWWGLCTITSYLNILKNISWQGGVFQTPACSVMHCWGLLLSSGYCLDSAPRWTPLPTATGPRGSGAICDSSRYLIPGFSCILQLQWQWKARMGRLTTAPLTAKSWEGWQTTKAQLLQCQGINGAPDCLMEFSFFPTEQNIN